MKASIAGSKKGSLPKIYHPVPAIGSVQISPSFPSVFSPFSPHIFSTLFFVLPPGFYHLASGDRIGSGT
jgi:hypothetical protein